MTLDDSPLPFTTAAAKVAVKHGQKLKDITTNIHEPAVSDTALARRTFNPWSRHGATPQVY
jgi:hypothetical protein